MRRRVCRIRFRFCLSFCFISSWRFVLHIRLEYSQGTCPDAGNTQLSLYFVLRLLIFFHSCPEDTRSSSFSEINIHARVFAYNYGNRYCEWVMCWNLLTHFSVTKIIFLFCFVINEGWKFIIPFHGQACWQFHRNDQSSAFHLFVYSNILVDAIK